MAEKPEKFTSGGNPVTGEVFLPTTAGKHPAVLILHGTFGLMKEYRADIVSFADALVAKGIAATMPHYLESTDTEPGMGVLEVMGKNLPTWKKACSDALAVMASDARFDTTRLGVIGFSLGGHLALSLGMAPPTGVALKCIVDFFGPTTQAPLETNWSRLPPLLIHHGTKDPLVPFSESEYLVAQLEKAGKKKDRDFFFEAYEGEGHGFKGAALTKSRDATIEFISKTL